MTHYVCIHGHFYQPPRENPWLEEVELQDPAYPYHDWNQRITTECYAPNAASRILDADKKIINILNNYSKISFNFGPTLLSWLAKNDKETYAAIIEADAMSQKNFAGHGAALAQVYNHLIMPLANRKDKETQIIWGLADFEYRFKRKAEGMWLAETAVDLETLELLVEQGVKFTVLAPNQAKRVRKLGAKTWRDVSGNRIDPKRPYLVPLPSGKSIAVFFYDGPISRDVAFGGLLGNGGVFADRLLGAFVDSHEPQLVHLATDGESYGHHHRYGEMALSFCLYHLEENDLARLTIYGEYLEKFPPVFEAEIFENSSWSCAHGVERWKNNCGCASGLNPSWQQNWRAPLRQAMDWLRDRLLDIYEAKMRELGLDPWQARNQYIEVVLDRHEDKTRLFFERLAGRPLSWQAQSCARQLLEMQRHALLMYTSCGWFFDDISGLETIQVMSYAARAIQLAKIITGTDLEAEYLKLLELAPGNLPAFPNGRVVYEKIIQPERLDLFRVGAHYAVSSLFENYPESTKLFYYWIDKINFDRLSKGSKTLVLGQAHIYSSITATEADVGFLAIHRGGGEIWGGVVQQHDQVLFKALRLEFKEAFQKESDERLNALAHKYFDHHSYSLQHLFRDEQRKILMKMAGPALTEIRESLAKIFDQHYKTMRGLNKLQVSLPMALYTIARFVINDKLRQLLEADNYDLVAFQEIAKEFSAWPVKLDRQTLNYHASKVMSRLMWRHFSLPENLGWLKDAWAALSIFLAPPLKLELNLWQAQNLYFKIGQKLLNEMKRRFAQGQPEAEEWLKYFSLLGDGLAVRIN